MRTSAHAVLPAQRDEQIENLRLDGDVERGRRLVGDQQLRPAGERHRDHHALAHAAGELVRKGLHAPLGIGDADLLQQFDDSFRARAAVEIEMRLQRLADLEADGEAGIERGHRLLKDHRDVLARDLAAVPRAHRQQIRAVEAHRVGLDLRRQRQQAHHREHRDRLARAGFADDREHLVAIDRHVDAVDRLERAAARGEGDGEIADFEQRHRQLRRIFGSSASRRPSPVEVDRDDGDQDRKARQRDDPGIGADEFARIGEHRAPFRRRRLRAEAEEAEARRLEDGVGDAERGLHDQRREAIRQHGREHQPQRPDAGDARGGDIILVEFAERRGAHQPDVARQIDDRHRDDGVGEARAENRDDEDRQHQARHRHDEVHHARDHDVDDRARHRADEAEARRRSRTRRSSPQTPMNSETRAP